MLERIRQPLSSMRSYQLSTTVKERLEFFNARLPKSTFAVLERRDGLGWVHSPTGCVERSWVGSPYIQVSSSNRYKQPRLRLKFCQNTSLDTAPAAYNNLPSSLQVHTNSETQNYIISTRAFYRLCIVLIHSLFHFTLHCRCFFKFL